MKLITYLLMSFVSLVFRKKPVEGGFTTGLYKPGYYEDSSLSKHTIFTPANPLPDMKLLILIWSNDGCSSNNTYFRCSLWEVASHGSLPS